MTTTQTPKRPRMPRKKIIRLGKEIYKRDILPKVKDDHFGEYVAIEVKTGDWEIADSTMDAVDRLRERNPESDDILCERVGFRTARSFGGSSRSLIK